jgi:phosphoribosylamine--glycine ligase
MGAYSPAPIIDMALRERVLSEVIYPTLKGMAAEGRPYVGFLFAGLMITTDGTPKVLEYNCRFGDPETQPLMVRLKTDLAEACLAILRGETRRLRLDFDPRAAVGVVLAAGGYPGEYAKGSRITGLEQDLPDTKVFHAGTAARDGKIVTSGGRVLGVTALGSTLREAHDRAYAAARTICFEGIHYRQDIAAKGLR